MSGGQGIIQEIEVCRWGTPFGHCSGGGTSVPISKRSFSGTQEAGSRRSLFAVTVDLTVASADQMSSGFLPSQSEPKFDDVPNWSIRMPPDIDVVNADYTQRIV